MKRAVIAPDKFRGTASAREAAQAMAETVERFGYRCDILPMSDGGEGLLEAFGGSVKSISVTGANKQPVEAMYKIDGEVALIEMAQAAGLSLVGGPQKNDPMAATTRGVGELIKDALFSGATRIIVGCGGSATTDGGYGAIEAIEPAVRLKGVELVVATDVEITFTEAARDFAPQKGATPAEVALLTKRLEALEKYYFQRFGVDISSVKGGGAAGGLAGALVALGGHIVSGFEVVAETTGFFEALEGADLVVTGEGFLDEQSYRGKVVGQVTDLAAAKSIPYLVVVGEYEPEVVRERADRAQIFSLVQNVGAQRALGDVLGSIKDTTEVALLSNGYLVGS